tara:strand:+ start:264 stop:821 length:558 start_codon:yes stop_codon:yes gene_type:complete
MKFAYFLFLVFILSSCTKPKTVLICGDHICVNKDEARQFFEENLSLEVKIIDNKIKKEIDLVELNIRNNNKKNRKISISPKKKTNKDLKKLSDKEIKQIKKNIRKKNKKITKKIIDKKTQSKGEKYKKKQKLDQNKKEISEISVNKNQKKVLDVCKLIERCNIDEISKYLIEESKRKKFPDITQR